MPICSPVDCLVYGDEALTYLIIFCVFMGAIFIGAVGFALCERHIPWDES